MKSLAAALIRSGGITTNYFKEQAEEQLVKVNKLLDENPNYKEDLEDLIENLENVCGLEAEQDVPTDKAIEIKSLIDTTISRLQRIDKLEEERKKLIDYKKALIVNSAVLERIEDRMNKVNSNGDFVRAREINGKPASIFRSVLTVYFRDGKRLIIEHYSSDISKSFVNSKRDKIMNHDIEDEWLLGVEAWKSIREIYRNTDLITEEGYALYKESTAVKELDKGYEKYKSKQNTQK